MQATRCLLVVLAVASSLMTAWSWSEESLTPLTRFDSKGQLPQSNAAAQAVQQGGPVVAITSTEYVLLVAPSTRKPPLIDLYGIPKMWRLSNSMCLSHAGLSQDSRALALLAQEAILNHADRFGDEDVMTVGEVVDVLASRLQEATMQASKRPYGTSFLVAGIRPSRWGGKHESSHQQGSSVLYRTDPSGAYSKWKACAIGQGSEKMMAVLEDAYAEDLDLEAMVSLAVKAISSSGRTSHVDVALVGPGICRLCERVSLETLPENVLAAAKANKGATGCAE